MITNTINSTTKALSSIYDGLYKAIKDEVIKKNKVTKKYNDSHLPIDIQEDCDNMCKECIHAYDCSASPLYDFPLLYNPNYILPIVEDYSQLPF